VVIVKDRQHVLTGNQRLYLGETPLHVIEARLERDDFQAGVQITGQVRSGHFVPEWQADALGSFPGLAETWTPTPGRAGSSRKRGLPG